MPRRSGQYLTHQFHRFCFDCPCGYTTRDYPNDQFTKKLLKLHIERCERCKLATIEKTQEVIVDIKTNY